MFNKRIHLLSKKVERKTNKKCKSQTILMEDINENIFETILIRTILVEYVGLYYPMYLVCKSWANVYLAYLRPKKNLFFVEWDRVKNEARFSILPRYISIISVVALDRYMWYARYGCLRDLTDDIKNEILNKVMKYDEFTINLLIKNRNDLYFNFRENINLKCLQIVFDKEFLFYYHIRLSQMIHTNKYHMEKINTIVENVFSHLEINRKNIKCFLKDVLCMKYYYMYLKENLGIFSSIEIENDWKQISKPFDGSNTTMIYSGILISIKPSPEVYISRYDKDTEYMIEHFYLNRNLIFLKIMIHKNYDMIDRRFLDSFLFRKCEPSCIDRKENCLFCVVRYQCVEKNILKDSEFKSWCPLLLLIIFYGNDIVPLYLKEKIKNLHIPDNCHMIIDLVYKFLCQLLSEYSNNCWLFHKEGLMNYREYQIYSRVNEFSPKYLKVVFDNSNHFRYRMRSHPLKLLLCQEVIQIYHNDTKKHKIMN